jgi:ADP-heptose:LPS heptosyltransferase
LQRKILIRRKEALGDVLLASSVLRPVKNRFPDHEIDFATDTPEILEHHPLINTVLPGTAHGAGYDIVYDLDLAYELRPRCSILESYAAVVGVQAKDLHLSITVEEKAKQQALSLLKEKGIHDNRPLAALQTAGSFWVKNWPVAAYKQVSDALRSQLGVTPVVLGSPGDPAIEGAIDLRGAADIKTSIALLSCCTVFIGIDSFLLHCAKALGLPVAAFFGHSDPKLRIVMDKKDLLFVSPLGCRFCHHRLKPPVFATICRRQNIALHLVDTVFHKLQRRAYVNNSAFAQRWYLRLGCRMQWREKGRVIAPCMKEISPDFAAPKIVQWLQATLTPPLAAPNSPSRAAIVAAP